jgi:hypothetical protein
MTSPQLNSSADYVPVKQNDTKFSRYPQNSKGLHYQKNFEKFKQGSNSLLFIFQQIFQTTNLPTNKLKKGKQKFKNFAKLLEKFDIF